MQIFVKLGLRPHESCDGPANRRVVLQIENWSFCSRTVACWYHGLWLHMVYEVLTCLSTLPRSLHCLGSAVLDGFLWGCGGKFSHFSLLRLPSHEDGDIDEGELMRCSSYPQNAKSSPLPDRNESIAVYCCNRFKKPSCMPLTRVQQTSINLWTSPKSKSKKNPCKSIWTEWTNWTTALNQPNHWIHLTKVRSRNEKFVREEGRPHELSCGYSRTCAIFFAPRPRA